MVLIERYEVEPSGRVRVKIADGNGFMADAMRRVRGDDPSPRIPHPLDGDVIDLAGLRSMTGSGLGPQLGRLRAIDGCPGEYSIETVAGDRVVRD